MPGVSMKMLLFIAFLLWGTAALAEAPVYVTRADCARLMAHHPDPGVDYKPGTDAHGHYVAPADLPDQNGLTLPDKIEFDLRINPLAYAPQGNVPAGAFQNTGANIGHVEIDLASGAAKLNGHALDGEQTAIVTEACRKAGYR